MIEIVIWVSPVDLDDLEKTLNRLLIGKDYLSEEQRKNIRFNVVMGVSDEIINWKTKTIKSECEIRFKELKSLTNWAGEYNFVESTTINGCTSMRVNASKSNAEYYLWLDTDIIYQPETFPYMINSVSHIEENGFDKFVITPEIVRIWDSTWDCIVNENFLNKEVGYQKIHNPYEDAKIYGDITIEEVICKVPGQPYMKFAGGWFTILSKKLLNELPWPDEYGHYGYDDTYLMWAASIKNDSTIKQFKLKNLVVSENYFDRITSYKGLVELIDKREEYKNYNLEKANISLLKLASNS
jgi:hypothetical protein